MDKAIQSLKKKLRVLADTEGGNWSSLLARATSSLNDTPKPEVLHGESPNEVKDQPAVQMMLLEDNAAKLKHNDDQAKSKQKALNQAGNAFRAPLKIDKKWTKRGFRATYGPVVRAADIENGWVTGLDNKRYDLKAIKPVRAG